MRFLIFPLLLIGSVSSAVTPRVHMRDVALGNERFNLVVTVEAPGLPVTVTLDPGADDENCAPSTLPLTRVIWKAGETVLAEVGPGKAGQRWRCAYTFTSVLGDSTRASPDACTLSIPFRPEGHFKVIQGFDGALTHHGQVRHAIDFAMPEGTPVLAARDGLVVWVQDDAEDGTRLGGNSVGLLHADGTFTQYSHLKRGTVLVRDGQSIGRGSVLALSGSTNLTPITPHLHFEVFLHPGLQRKTLPFTISLSGGSCRTPTEGEVL